MNELYFCVKHGYRFTMPWDPHCDECRHENDAREYERARTYEDWSAYLIALRQLLTHVQDLANLGEHLKALDYAHKAGEACRDLQAALVKQYAVEAQRTDDRLAFNPERSG